jgi:TPR repeat protein
MYLEGKGVPQDVVEAYFWLNLAAGQNEEYAKHRDNAAAKLTPREIDEVQASCTKWLDEFEKLMR